MKICVLFVMAARRYIVLPVSLPSNAKYLKADILRVMSEQKMIKICKSCGKEFQNLTQGVLYSSHAIGVLEFCSDDCSKNYFNSVMK
jgi:hypothetical protein